MADNEGLNRPLFDPKDANWLASRNELSQAGPNKFRISRRRFQNRSSDEDPPATPSTSATPSVSSPATSSNSPDAEDDKIIEVPLHLHSVETLSILGFNDQKANELFQKWTNLDPIVRENFADFFEMSQLWLDYRDIDAASSSDDWDGALRRLGIGEQLRQAILKPGFDEVRLTESALWWVKFSMKMRWEALEEGYDASRERAKGLGLRGGGHPDTPFTYKKAYGKMFEPCADQPGDIILWKATGKTRMRSVFLQNPIMQEFDINQLASQPPTDFGGLTSLNYFTPELEGAQHYLRYIKDISDPQGVCLARIAVPNGIIEQAKPMILRWPSDVLKKTLWYSRNRQKASRHVPELKGHHLLIGNTSKGTHVVFNKMQHWTEVKKENLVHLSNGELMTQYVFNEDLGIEINESCQGKLRVVHGEKPEEDVNIFDDWSKGAS